MSRDHLFFYLNGRPVRVTGDDAFLTVSDYLRRRQNLTGSKIVCAEGDCGACSVLVGRPIDDKLNYRTVCGCIQSLFQVDGTHVISVEGLKYGQSLNPIQESFVKCHGAQCGYCTPGFVVALYEHVNAGRSCERAGIQRALVGNLCRCTGYDSIMDAARQTDRSSFRAIDTLYPPAAIVADLAAADAGEVRLTAGDRLFAKPASVASAVAFKAEHPDCTVVSGGTDVGVGINKRKLSPTVFLSTAAIASCRGVRVEDCSLVIGAAATITELESAAFESIPSLAAFLQSFASPQIRNAGTPVGNVATASPIGDLLPVLMVLETEVELAGPGGERRVNLNVFYTGYRKTVMKPDELIIALHVPLPERSATLRLYKVSRRKDLDISAVSAAFFVGKTETKIAFGGVAATPVRSPRAEAILAGAELNDELIEQAAEAAAEDVTPLTDFRGSADYRQALVRNLVRKFGLDSGSLAAS